MQQAKETLGAMLSRLKKSAMTRSASGPNGQPRQAAGTSPGAETEKLEPLGIHRRFLNATFEEIEARGLPANEDIRQNFARAKDYASAIEENVRRGIGMILAGGCGTLKTTMAVAVLRHWTDAGHCGLLVPMVSLIDNLATLRTLNREEMARYESKIRKTALLVLDDLGGENTGQGWVLSKVDAIITERYNRMLPTIITTNLGKKELAETYPGRIMDRLRNTSIYLAFSSESQRSAIE